MGICQRGICMIKDELNLDLKKIEEQNAKMNINIVETKNNKFLDAETFKHKMTISKNIEKEIREITKNNSKLKISKKVTKNHHVYFELFEGFACNNWNVRIRIRIHIDEITIRISYDTWYPLAIKLAEMMKEKGYEIKVGKMRRYYEQ
jgi:hypothetical protein